MSLAADAAIFEERDEPGLARSIGLALAVHVMLGLVLFFGVRWQSKPPETIAVELWVPPPPVAVVEPTRRAFLRRSAIGSIPSASATRSRLLSTANADWVTPKPRKAPHGALLVYMA